MSATRSLRSNGCDAPVATGVALALHRHGTGAGAGCPGTGIPGMRERGKPGKPGTGTAAAWSIGVTGLGASSGGASPRFAAIPLLGIFEAVAMPRCGTLRP